MTNVITAATVNAKIEAADEAGKLEVFTDHIQDSLRDAIFPVARDALELTVAWFEEPEQAQDLVAHVWHTFSREFTNGGSEHGPKTRAAFAEYLNKNLDEEALTIVKKLKGYQDANKAKVLGKVGLGFAQKKKAAAK